MPSGEVHWHEGMFLRPHHFLAEHRRALGLIQVDGKWNQQHNWGLRSISLNTEALSNHRFSVASLKARLRDGTLVEVPEEGPLSDLDLKPAFVAERKVTVLLGVPMLRSGQPNVAAEQPAEGLRYYSRMQQVDDENVGSNLQPIAIRRLNVRLLLSTQDLSGYDAIPIARVEKSERAEATPQLDPSYIPPLLACDAWHELSVEILRVIYDRIGRKIEKLANQAVSRGLSLESTAPGDVLIFSQLRELNEAYATLTNLAFLEGIHPLPAYLELCRLVGQLSVFGPGRRTPAIPRYDHDDLGGCFHRIKNYLDDLLSIVPEPDYQERPFVGYGLRMQVSLERSWLDQSVHLYFGVRSPLDADACVELMGPRGIDMKVGSSDRIETIYRLGDLGLKFSHVPTPSLPQALPRDKGLIYFEINREQQQNEWQYVERSLTLAIRFNESKIVGNIDGHETINLRLSSEMPFRFALFMLGAGVSAKP
ncbi:type VI secretion system baseplate subunit TssK [Aquisphaera insulae]|uniref:type VI secretion system baseplate subunit TssK n=1 Tax=Aquisphaera insulae TaxID=2712864 RepID=UPI0013ECA2FC|nr:type VI secretion system baseplate subunit TssK [Aquisphaera insulae]